MPWNSLQLTPWQRRVLALVVFEALGVVGTVGAAHDAGSGAAHLNAMALALVVVAVAAAVLARLAPTAACLAAIGMVFAYGVAGFPGGPIYLAVTVTLFRAVDPERPRRSVVLGVVAVLASVGESAATHGFSNLAQGVGTVVGSIAWVGAPLVLGHFIATRRAYTASLAERAHLAEQTREEEGQRRVTEERLRIARELHDVLAHTISVINVQAGMAVHVMDSRPEEARQAMATVRETSHEAMRELRSVLDVLREEPPAGGRTSTDATPHPLGRRESGPPAPAPGLAELPALLSTMIQAGLPTRLTTHGEPRQLPRVVDLAAYRIVQESLTNVLRHAHASNADVVVTHGAELRVEISDDGHAFVGENDAAPGHGITGMRERAQSLGGSLEAGPRGGGGFRVEAVLPIAERATT
jgi:signal transduction histidine kinase